MIGHSGQNRADVQVAGRNMGRHNAVVFQVSQVDGKRSGNRWFDRNDFVMLVERVILLVAMTCSAEFQ